MDDFVSKRSTIDDDHIHNIMVCCQIRKRMWSLCVEQLTFILMASTITLLPPVFHVMSTITLMMTPMIMSMMIMLLMMTLMMMVMMTVMTMVLNIHLPTTMTMAINMIVFHPVI